MEAKTAKVVYFLCCDHVECHDSDHASVRLLFWHGQPDRCGDESADFVGHQHCVLWHHGCLFAGSYLDSWRYVPGKGDFLAHSVCAVDGRHSGRFSSGGGIYQQRLYNFLAGVLLCAVGRVFVAKKTKAPCIGLLCLYRVVHCTDSKLGRTFAG